MAEKNTDREDDEEITETEEEAAAKAVEAAARKKKLVLLAVIGVVLLLVAGGGTWLALRMLGGSKAPTEEQAKTEETGKVDEKNKTEEAKSEKKVEHKEAIYDVLEPAFLATYEVAGRQHYLQMSLAVMAREQSAIDDLHTHMPLVRNRIVMLLSGELFEQLQTDEGRVQLQQKLLAAIQEILKKETGKADVEQVFFNSFVMQ